MSADRHWWPAAPIETPDICDRLLQQREVWGQLVSTQDGCNHMVLTQWWHLTLFELNLVQHVRNQSLWRKRVRNNTWLTDTSGEVLIFVNLTETFFAKNTFQAFLEVNISILLLWWRPLNVRGWALYKRKVRSLKTGSDHNSRMLFATLFLF